MSEVLNVSLEQGELVDKMKAGELDIAPLQPRDEGYTDPLEVEARLLKEEHDRMNKQPDQEEIACMMIKLYTPRFCQMVDGLSNRQLRRVMKALIEYPLGKDYRHPSKQEEECFMIGNSLMDAKMVLITKTYQEHHDDIIEMANKASAEATLEFGDKTEEQTKEVMNG